jgi:hypothetical protein
MASHFIVGHRTGGLSDDSNNRAGDLGRSVAGRPVRRREIMVHSWIVGAKRTGCVVHDASFGSAVHTQPYR